MAKPAQKPAQLKSEAPPARIADAPGDTESRIARQLDRLDRLAECGMRLIEYATQRAAPEHNPSPEELSDLCLAHTRVARAIRQISAMEQEILGLRKMRNHMVRGSLVDRAARMDRADDDNDCDEDERGDLRDRNDLNDLHDLIDDLDGALDHGLKGGGDIAGRIQSTLTRIAGKHGGVAPSSPKNAPRYDDGLDGDALDRRITAELDRIAARKRQFAESEAARGNRDPP